MPKNAERRPVLENDLKRMKRLRSAGKGWAQILDILGFENYSQEEMTIIFNRVQAARGGRCRDIPWPRPTQCPIAGPWRHYRTHEWHP